jgi:ATP-dependent 26S proteasome regulatory subunit
MTDYDQWLAANDRFLSELVAWLRGRLEQLAGPELARPGDEPRPASSRSLLERRRRPELASPVQVTPTGPPGAAPSGTAPAALAEAERLDEPPPLILLVRRLGLSAFERDVLMLATAMELDTRIASLCARAQHDPQRPYPTFALALTLFDRPSWDVMSPERPLRHWQLIDVGQARAEPLTASRLTADERIVNFIKGLNHLDGRLTPLLRPLRRPDGADLSPSQLTTAAAITAALHRSAAEGRSLFIQLLGPDPVSKRLVAARAAAEVGLDLFEMSSDDLPAAGADFDVFARLWHRESLLSPIALLIEAADADEHGAAASAVRRWLPAQAGLVMLDLREPWPWPGAAALIADVARPTAAEQRAAWQAALGARAGASPEWLAGQFDLNVPVIGRIVRNAIPADASVLDEGVAARLWDSCLMESRPALDQMAQRIDPKATWPDLKLPAEEEQLLRQIESQVAHRAEVYDTFGFRDRMNRGLGISVLFAGESGTGKTMAAEVLASALGLMLYRIDLSAVVSKYIGETEKNLRKLFDAAEGGGAILFFDEADALFGKRSEVKDSHDRYANIEVNYLLQRMETFRGLAVLASNRKSALDTAFLRRLRFVVNFPFPGASERAAIWAGAFPAGTPLGALDYDRLARLHLTGGSIQNVALSAAFAAAQASGPVTMPVVLSAARAEVRKLDKPVNEADFRWLEKAEGSA